MSRIRLLLTLLLIILMLVSVLKLLRLNVPAYCLNTPDKVRSRVLVYLINVKGVPSYRCFKDDIAEGIRRILESSEYSEYIIVRFVDDLRDLENLYRVKANVTTRVLVVNCHGEILPAPTKYEDERKGLIYIEHIADFVSRNGVIWVNVAGVPFYYINSLGVKIGERGLKTFYARLGYDCVIYHFKNGVAFLSAEGKESLLRFRLNFTLPSKVPVRVAFKSNMPLIKNYYSCRQGFNVASFKAGNGILVLCCIQVSDELLTYIISSIILDMVFGVRLNVDISYHPILMKYTVKVNVLNLNPKYPFNGMLIFKFNGKIIGKRDIVVPPCMSENVTFVKLYCVPLYSLLEVEVKPNYGASKFHVRKASYPLPWIVLGLVMTVLLLRKLIQHVRRV